MMKIFLTCSLFKFKPNQWMKWQYIYNYFVLDELICKQMRTTILLTIIPAYVCTHTHLSFYLFIQKFYLKNEKDKPNISKNTHIYMYKLKV